VTLQQSVDKREPWLVFRRWPGLLLFLIGAGLAFVLMANDRQLSVGVPLGALACLIATVGLLDVCGTFESTPTVCETETAPTLGRELATFAFAICAFIAATRWVVAGTLPGEPYSTALLLPLLLGVSIVQFYRTARALGVFGSKTDSIFKHPSLWLLLVTVAVYAPQLGNYSLVDPWETHYGEVAREILTRDDWVSLWWAQDGWFWSKPILDFWLQALSMSLFGVHHVPDGMLAGIALGRSPYPEWAVRLPMLLLSLFAQVTLYSAVAKLWGRRAALFGSLVLVSVPYYTLIVHQSMTDLPYIATLMGALGLFILGFYSSDEETVRGYRVVLGRRTVILSAHTLVLGFIVLFALPQILYLFSRNVGLITSGPDLGFFLHADRFFSGSGGGNCGLPGNAPCAWHHAEIPSPEPSLSALCWTVLLGVLLFIERGERRKKSLFYLGAWTCVALSALAKGLPGPVIFLGTVVVSVVITRRFSESLKLELPSALLLLAVIALPWFVQATVRHGSGFLERLFVHDMYKRAFVHVHDTNAGDDVSLRYYLWQLGYGLFPATGVVVIGTLGALVGRDETRHRNQSLASILGIWALVGFGMFSLTLTKFHHYIIPIVPALCLLTGPLLDNAFAHRGFCFNQGSPCRYRTSKGFDFVLVAIVASLVVLFAGLDLFGPNNPPGGAARFINLVTYNYTRPWPDTLDFKNTLFAFTVVIVVSLFALMLSQPLRTYAAALYLTVSLLFSAWLGNRYLPLVAPHWGQRETIATYYRTRKGPQEPLVAYQMNWKGENFYTGNRLATFINTGEKLKQWVSRQRKLGKLVLFFTLEHNRVAGLKQELGRVQEFTLLTDKRVNNKFTLVRVTLSAPPTSGSETTD
jgi:4-amino-4-deoxy-L-arabinose transferase-like glycosyltransferase